MSQDFPSADQLLEAVAGYLFAELRPQVPRSERFRILVAANVCAVVAREIRAGDGPARADLALFAEFLDDGDAAPASPAGAAARAAAGELASRIRAGDLDPRLDELIERLPEHVRRKLEVARPGYAD